MLILRRAFYNELLFQHNDRYPITQLAYTYLRIFICAYGEAERRYCSGGVYGDVGMYVDKITRRGIDKYNTFCMQMLLILLTSTLAVQESVMISIKGNIKV